MIRILHSVSNMDRAGIETMLMNYYRHIDRNEIQFDFLCNKAKPGAYDQEIIDMGGRIFYTPGLNPFKYLKYLKCSNQLFKEHPEYHIVHAHNGAFVVYPLFAAKINKIPARISHVHSASFTVDFKWPLKVLFKPFIPLVATSKWACGEAAAKFYYGKATLKFNNTKVINNAIEIRRFKFNSDVRNKLREKYKLDSKIVIGHAGRFMSQKNHIFLIDIFSEVHKLEPKAVLVLLGDGELENVIKEKVSKLGLNDSVLFMGNVANTNEWYQAFDIFVLPSIWEGLPVVGIEAQTADLPCVFSSDVTKEVRILSTTQFVKRSESTQVWASTILQLASNPTRVDRTQEIKDAGYDIEVEAKSLEQTYKELLISNKIK